MKRTILPLITVVLISSCDGEGSGVTITVEPEHHRVEVRMDGELFTAYRFGPGLEKPVLFPVNAPGGIAVTRGYPLEAREGERADHPPIWHARGYGLFSVNNLVQKAYQTDLPAVRHVLTEGESLTLKHRLAVVRGDPQEDEVNRLFSRFSEE